MAAYATIQDMVRRYGQVEMIRLTVADGQEAVAIDTVRLQDALDRAAATIDSYVRRRYQTPVTPAPAELVDANGVLARFDLMFGEGREPTEQARLQHKQKIEWLESVRDGKTFLADATPAGQQSSAMVRDRGVAPYQNDGDPTGANVGSTAGGFIGGGGFYGDGW